MWKFTVVWHLLGFAGSLSMAPLRRTEPSLCILWVALAAANAYLALNAAERIARKH